MPALKDIQKTFGSDARFQLIGLSCDETAEVAERYIKQNGLIWTHGFAGNLLAGVNAGKVYKLRAIPATFLIGPDGRILAKNLRGAELKEAVRQALQGNKVFSKSPIATRPLRFPITRFEYARREAGRGALGRRPRRLRCRLRGEASPSSRTSHPVQAR